MKNISVTTTLDNIIYGDSRLDATYYASDVFQAKQILDDYKENGNEVLKIRDFQVEHLTHPQ